jgi:O-methyltransferase involved in polyketide biosynthesis
MQVKEAIHRGGLEADVPTFIIAECVLVYLKAEESNALVNLLADFFSTAAILVCFFVYFWHVQVFCVLRCP